MHTISGNDNRIGDVMVSVFVLNVVYCVFEFRKNRNSSKKLKVQLSLSKGNFSIRS